MESPRLTRKSKQQLTRAAIIDAAAAEFAAHGVEGTSLDAIVRRAGLTQGAIYSNFANKADLWSAVTEQFSRTLDLVELLDTTRPLPVQLATLGVEVWRLLTSASRADLLLTQEFDLYLMRRPRERAKHARGLREIERALAEALERGAAEREEALPVQAELLASTIQTATYGLLHRFMLDPQAVDEQLCVRTFASLAGTMDDATQLTATRLPAARLPRRRASP